MRNPDSFVMNEDTVNIAVADFLEFNGFICDPPLSGRQPGIDVKARKNGVSVFVESKGSQKNGAISDDEVFNHGQIVNHLARQIHTLMKYASQYGESSNLFVLANPDIQRIRNEFERVKPMVDKMQFVCFWVQKDKSVLVEGPKSNEDLLSTVELY